MRVPEGPKKGLTRRTVIRRSLQAGAYTAPVVLSAITVRPVGAQVTMPTVTPVPTATLIPMVLCMQPVAFGQDLLLFNAAPNVTYDIYYVTNMGPAASATRLMPSITTDAAGVGGQVYNLALNSSTTTSVTLIVTVAGQPPTNPATTRVSTLVTVLACTAGAARAAASLIGFIVQESAVAGNRLTFVDAGLFNAAVNTMYDIYIRVNGGAAVKVTTVTTNAAGNSTAITSLNVAATATTVQLIAVLAGASPATPLFSTIVAGSSLVALPAPAPGATVANTVPEARTLR